MLSFKEEFKVLSCLIQHLIISTYQFSWDRGWVYFCQILIHTPKSKKVLITKCKEYVRDQLSRALSRSSMADLFNKKYPLVSKGIGLDTL
jgi:hypothetical protein